MLRRILMSLLVVTPVLATAPAAAAAGEVRDIVFPVVGAVSYTDTFGAPRGGSRTHAGQDLMAEKMQRLVAAADGTISWITIPEASYGYMLTITDDDGWSYHYVHVNNDTPGTDDGKADLADVFGPGIERGARVTAGQLVGYVGDSGNAEDVAPQLHFEIETPDGRPINPMASLEAAQAAATPSPSTTSPFERLAGSDRVATAVAVSRAAWADGTATSAVVADGSRYAEALPASVLAGTLGGPLLLITGGEMPSAVEDELRRLGVTRLVSVGSVREAVADRARELGLQVERVGAPGVPEATAAAIARRIGDDAPGVMLVSIDSFADAIAASTIAVGNDRPILLSRRDYVPQVTVDAWRALDSPPMTVVGGSAVVGENVQRFFGADRLAGNDRYATSATVADAAIASGRSLDEVTVATGTAFPDAVAAGPLADRRSGVTVLVDGSGHRDDDATRSWLASRADSVGEVVILGGAAAVSAAAEDAVRVALSR